MLIGEKRSRTDTSRAAYATGRLLPEKRHLLIGDRYSERFCKAHVQELVF